MNGFFGFIYCPIWGMSLREFVDHGEYLDGVHQNNEEVMHSQTTHRATRRYRILPIRDQITEDELFTLV